MSEEIIFVKRNSHSQLRTFKNPVMKLELKGSRFIISQKIADALGLDNDSGLMFGFNQKNKTAYMVQDNEDDSFRLKRKDQHTLRFTSKDLMIFFIDTFDLLESGDTVFVFNVELKPNEKGLYKITKK